MRAAVRAAALARRFVGVQENWEAMDRREALEARRWYIFSLALPLSMVVVGRVPVVRRVAPLARARRRRNASEEREGDAAPRLAEARGTQHIP